MGGTKGVGSVFKDKRGYWNASIELPPKLNGDRRRKVVRRKSKPEVIAELNRLRKELDDNGDIVTRAKTVDEWMTYWLENIIVKHRRPNTVSAYRTAMKNHIIPVIGKTRLTKVTPAHVRSVLTFMEQRGLSSTSAKQTHGIMSSAFEEAVRDGDMSTNPAKRVRSPSRTMPELEVLTLEESVRLLHAASLDPVFGARWATALLTGARRGEVLGLTRDRITDVLDFSSQLQALYDVRAVGEPIVPDGYQFKHLVGPYYLTPPKSKHGQRVIPLFEPLRSIIERHIESTPDNPWGLVFAPHGMPTSLDADARSLKKLLAAAGIDKKVRIHDLRHTAVDLLYFAGVPEDLLISIVGHSTRAMSRSYKSRGIDARTRDAMDRFGAIFTPTSPSLPSGGR